MDLGTQDSEPYALVLYDSTCGLCNRAVRFIADRDSRRRFCFAPLGSRIARSAMATASLDPGTRDAVVLAERGRVYTRSSAALRIARGLRMPWPLLYAFIVVPPPIRDAVYRFVAGNRHRLGTACVAPSEAVRERLVSEGWEGP